MSRAAFDNRNTGVLTHSLIVGGHPPKDLQPDEVPSLLRALDATVRRASSISCSALRAQTREIKKATATLPPPPPPSDEQPST